MASLTDTVKLYLKKKEKEQKEEKEGWKEGRKEERMERGKEGKRNWGLERLTVEWFQLFRMNTVPEEDLSFFPSTHVRWFMAF